MMNIEVKIAPQIPQDHWLRSEPLYSWFVQGYGYACSQNEAIPALSEVSDIGSLYHAVSAILRENGIQPDENGELKMQE